MKQQSRLKAGLRNQEQHSSEEVSQVTNQAREYESVEELLREDAAQTEVPPSIAERLQNSLAKLPEHRRPWWRRFLGS